MGNNVTGQPDMQFNSPSYIADLKFSDDVAVLSYSPAAIHPILDRITIKWTSKSTRTKLKHSQPFRSQVLNNFPSTASELKMSSLTQDRFSGRTEEQRTKLLRSYYKALRAFLQLWGVLCARIEIGLQKDWHLRGAVLPCSLIDAKSCRYELNISGGWKYSTPVLATNPSDKLGRMNSSQRRKNTMWRYSTAVHLLQTPLAALILSCPTALRRRTFSALFGMAFPAGNDDRCHWRGRRVFRLNINIRSLLLGTKLDGDL